ncbi:MFS transporter [Shewanella atlantica]|uniref:MFS transporter n=1 Tax=Shewanella atlantica TaxID=271099 RepID=A0A431VS58_9GAMM|nr:MFS transporter [Shewanella atlantica]RTR25974.1 MFS transporter [Shewanella atlantica]
MVLSRRFFPYFVTQCLGALNDNVYKNVLLLFVTYSQVESLPIGVNLFVNLAAGLFILPFFLFSAHAGIIADNMDKALLIKRLKLLEVIIMLCAAVAILTQSYLLMLLLLFLTGVQSAYFGPVKYSLLPQVLKDKELVKGNAWVEMGTFISILTGTITAGFIVASDSPKFFAAMSVCFLALSGYLSSLLIPAIPLNREPNKLRFAPFSGTINSIRKVQRTPSIWIAVLAISWFWFLGATYLTQFPNFAKIHLHSGATVVSLLLALFSIGIAVGSFTCERFSFKQVELGLLPFGLLGLALFGVDLYWAIPGGAWEQEQVYTALSFLYESKHYRLMFDLFMVGVSGGVFIVPLYAFIQARTKEGECAQAIAANNILNALFMVVSALVSMIILGILNWTIIELFLLLAITNFAVGLFLYIRQPELGMRFIAYLHSRIFHPVTVIDRDLIPRTEGALLIGSSSTPKELFLLQHLSIRQIRIMVKGALRQDWWSGLLRWSGKTVEFTFSQNMGVDVHHCEEREEMLSQIELALSDNELVYLSKEDYLLLSDALSVRLAAFPKCNISINSSEASKPEAGGQRADTSLIVTLV